MRELLRESSGKSQVFLCQYGVTEGEELFTEGAAAGVSSGRRGHSRPVLTGSGPAIAIDALSFLVAAGCLARLPLTTSPAALRGAGMLTDIHEGWTQFRRTPWVSAVTVTFCVGLLVVGALPLIALGARQHAPWRNVS